MSLVDLTPQVRATLERAADWQSPGRLTLAPNWMPLHAAIKSAAALTGLYALGLPRGLRYDKGQTRIIYIGSAKDLGKRLATHCRAPHNDVIGCLRATIPDSLMATWWALPSLSRKWLLGLEGEALWTFERTFGTVPIGNLDIPESHVTERCKGLVVFAPCTDLTDAPTLTEYAAKIGRILVSEKKTPIGDPSQVAMTFRISSKGELICGQEKYNSARFYSPEEFADDRQAKDCPLTENGDRVPEIDFIIHETHVAVWPVEKMKQLIDICSRLVPEESRAQSSVKRFQSPNRQVPAPHTWGEVAIVQGRLLEGTWFPSSPVRVKVLCGKELLGQAFLSAKSEHGESRFRAEDISDVPQREGRRPALWDPGSESQSSLTNDYIANMNARFERTDAEISSLDAQVSDGRADERQLDEMLKTQRLEMKEQFAKLERLGAIEIRQHLETTGRLIESLFQKACEELGRK